MSEIVYIAGTETKRKASVSDLALPLVPLMTNLYGWWNAENTYTDSNKTTRCSASGTDKCVNMADLSNNGRDFLQTSTPTDHRQPTYYSNVKNGYPALRFNSGGDTDNKMQASGATISRPYTTYMVYKINAWVVNKYIFEPNSSNSANFAMRGSSPQVMFGGASADSSGTNSTLDFEMVMHVWTAGSPASIMKLNNNTSVTATNLGIGDWSAAWLPYSQGGTTANIDVCELLVYSVLHDPDTDDGLFIRKYLNSKYALGLSI